MSEWFFVSSGDWSVLWFPPFPQVYNLLLGLLGRAKLYVDVAVHGTTKLVQYFSFMTYCLISKTEKLMFSSFFMDLWNLFQVRRTKTKPRSQPAFSPGVIPGTN